MVQEEIVAKTLAPSSSMSLSRTFKNCVYNA